MPEDTVRGNDVATLRRVNVRTVLQLLLDRPDHAFSVTELADLTALSRPTVSSVLHSLVSEGWSVTTEEDAPAARAGRPAQHFAFNRNAGVCIGVDAGLHSVRAVIVDLSGQTVATTRRDFEDLSDPTAAVGAIKSTIDAAQNGSPTPVLGITIAVPGVVDPRGELRESVVVPQWVNAGISTALAQFFPRAAVGMGNDVKLATIAEVHARPPESVRTLLYLSIGRRVSAGLVLDGLLHLGATGAAGELGASPSIAWAHAIDDAVREDTRSIGELAHAAHAGETTAVSTMNTIGTALAEGLALLALAIDPDVIIVAGPAAQAGDALTAPLARALQRTMTRPPRLELALVTTEPSATGAAQHCIDTFRRS